MRLDVFFGLDFFKDFSLYFPKRKANCAKGVDDFQFKKKTGF